MKKLFFSDILLIALSTVSLAQESPATPKAGHQLTDDFILQNQHYPEADLEAKKSGDVVVSFHLDEKGNGSAYQIKESFSEAANDDAIDLVKKILWNPATRNMLPVEYDMEYTVEYNAKAYKRFWKKRERIAVPMTLEADTSYKIYETRIKNRINFKKCSDKTNKSKY